MKLEEIFVGADRDRGLSDKVPIFASSAPVANIDRFQLRKTTKDDEIYYGLFIANDNKKDDFVDSLKGNRINLLAYLEIEKYDDNKYISVYSEVDPEIRGKGYGTFLYDYAVMNDKISLLSDSRQTAGSKGVWLRAKAAGKYKVIPYNITTDQAEPYKSEDEVYGSEHLVWLATPGEETINESLKRINSRNGGYVWEVVWYGPLVNNEY